MSLYKLQPVLKDYVWGGNRLAAMFGRENGGKKISESWEVSVHPDGESTCGGKKLSEIIAQQPGFIGENNAPLPVLVKYIDAAQNLSVQVHPNDAFAREHEGENGKTEMWYVVSAKEGAGIYCGFSRDISCEEFAEKVKDGSVEDCLNFIPVKEGDCYLIRAGTVHAIGAGCVICEIQQNSNVTYRVYDYNRLGADGKPRRLHVDKALRVIDFHRFTDETGGMPFENVRGGKLRVLTSCEYFCCRELLLDGEYGFTNARSFTALNVLSGEGCANGQPFAAGDSFIAPRGENILLVGKAKIIITNGAESL